MAPKAETHRNDGSDVVATVIEFDLEVVKD
jgi:hypothetical protein